MSKKVLKIAGYVLVALLVGASVLYNFFVFLAQYRFSLQQEGAQIAVQQVIQTINQTGKITINTKDAQGQDVSYTLIKEITPAKK